MQPSSNHISHEAEQTGLQRDMVPLVGTVPHPLRIAIIGAGPAGFYAVDHLFKQQDLAVEVDMFDRLPTPFGLVRSGVAPDHQNIKNVTRLFNRIAQRPHFHFYGNVEFGNHLALNDLTQHYHQVIFATGTQADRSLGIPGEDLRGSHAATAFVAWYNGHPDFRHLEFDLTQERVAVIGMGNVALDVARILCRTPEELARTDIADYALEALRHSRVREVYLLGRRGPAQAAFTAPEARELGDLEGADVMILPEEAELDALSQAALERDLERAVVKNVEIIQAYAQRTLTAKPKTLVLRFLVSPVEVYGDEEGHVSGLRLVRNELYRAEDGRLRPRPTEAYERLPVGLVFRSVGYRGVALSGVPFDAKRGIVPNEQGRVLDPDTGKPVQGLYVSGWIKRGPSGTVGANKADAAETIKSMLNDLEPGLLLSPSHPDAAAAERLIRSRQPHYFSYQDWQRIDGLEHALGRLHERPRVKLTRVEDMLETLDLKDACVVCEQSIEDKSRVYILSRLGTNQEGLTVLVVKPCCLNRFGERFGEGWLVYSLDAPQAGWQPL